MKQLKDKPNQPSRPGLRVRWNYFFDRTIAGGTPILMLWLAAISAAVVAVAALLMTFGLHPTDEPMGFGEAYWNAMGAALDPAPAEDTGWAYRAVMLAVAIIGILIVSTIIGVLTSGIEGKLDNLRRGRSLVLEHNHTIILGWSSKIAAAVRELAIANESHKRAVIAILADRDKVEMEEHLLDHAPDLGTTEIICRRGDPCDLADLTIVRPELARSVILFNDEGEMEMRTYSSGHWPSIAVPRIPDIVAPSLQRSLTARMLMQCPASGMYKSCSRPPDHENPPTSSPATWTEPGL